LWTPIWNARKALEKEKDELRGRISSADRAKKDETNNKKSQLLKENGRLQLEVSFLPQSFGKNMMKYSSFKSEATSCK
jgi:hypothetical protein